MNGPTLSRVNIPRGSLIGDENGYPKELDRPFWKVIAHQDYQKAASKQLVMEVTPTTREVHFILFVGSIRQGEYSNILEASDAFNEVV